jgi:hypothetical protein
MKISTFAIVVAILALFYGIALLFFPVEYVGSFGTTLDASTTVLARQFGTAFFGFSILYWNNRNIPVSDKSWAGLLWSNVFFNAANVIIISIAMANGLGNSMGWSIVILGIIFVLWSLYFIIKR